MLLSSLGLANENNLLFAQNLSSSGQQVLRSAHHLAGAEVLVTPMMRAMATPLLSNEVPKGARRHEREAQIAAATVRRAALAVFFMGIYSGSSAATSGAACMPGITKIESSPLKTGLANRQTAPLFDTSLIASQAMSPTYDPLRFEQGITVAQANERFFNFTATLNRTLAMPSSPGGFFASAIPSVESLVNNLTQPGILDLLAKALSEAANSIEQGYITVVQSLQSAAIFFSGYTDEATKPLGFSLATFATNPLIPYGPRTPTAQLPLLGTCLSGDSNTMKFIDIANLSLTASLSAKGDPSDPRPDSNNLPGQMEVDFGGLLAGINSQNGIYVGAYSPETPQTEAHHYIQTGMVDQSGTYLFGERSSATDAIAISPEKPTGYPAVGDYLPVDLSVEGIANLLNGSQQSDALPSTHFATYDELIQSAMNSVDLPHVDLGSIDPSFVNAPALDESGLMSDVKGATLIEFASVQSAVDHGITLASENAQPISTMVHGILDQLSNHPPLI